MTITETTTPTTPEPRPVGDRMRDRARRKRERVVPPLWRQIAELSETRMMTLTAIAAQLGVSRKRVSSIVNSPRFPPILADVERQAQAAGQRALAVHRRAAVDALGAALTDPDVPTVERLAAARVLLGASAPPSERMRDEARRELLSALPPALRRQVAEALSGSDTAALAALSDEELARLAGAP